MVRLTHDTIDFARLTDAVRRDHCGAVVLFLGTVRDVTGDQRTAWLDYEAYPGMAEKTLVQIEADARSRWPIGEIVIEHRLGRLDVGEISVAIALSCPHRAEAFEACQWTMDRVKELAPIWKRENAPGGDSFWVHPESASLRRD